MNDTIKIRGGIGETPELQDKELGYNRSKKVLYIGTPDGNVRLCGADDIAEVTTYIDELIKEIRERLEALENSEESEPEPEPDPPEEGEANG